MLAGGFSAIDAVIVWVVLVGTTFLAARLSRRQKTLRDFFLGGKDLPWVAVSASIVATEISAITMISLPFIVFREGGDWTYLQLGLVGSFLARCIVGYRVLPAFFRSNAEEGDIYSPYDFMSRRLGPGVGRLVTLLFSVGGLLGQAARVYLTALVLEVILWRELAWCEAQWGVDPLVTSMVIIGMVATLWTLLGGIATVVWTDAILCVLLLVGVIITLAVLDHHIAGGLPEALQRGLNAGKLRLWNFDTDPTEAMTFWAALFAVTFSGIGSYGTDHMLVQRLLCCRSESDARKAIIWSAAGMGITVAVAVVGVGLWAFIQDHPLSVEGARLVAEKGDRIYPVFIVESIPVGLKGLVLAGVFAAAVSSLDSMMAALSQTTLTSLVLPLWRKRQGPVGNQDCDWNLREERFALRASRWLVVAWGVALVLAGIAIEYAADDFDSILDLALAAATLSAGAILAAFFLATGRHARSAAGLYYSAPLSMLLVFSLVWHSAAALAFIQGASALLVLAWMGCRLWPARRGADLVTEGLRALVLGLGCAGVCWVCVHGEWSQTDGSLKSLAWPWYVPCGAIVALAFAFLLGASRPAVEPDPTP
jgi:SSS family solute:Na+ symporter